MKTKKKKQIVVAVSGGFDPLQVGHVSLFREAKKFGDKLVVILNNDNWLKLKKGYVFMPESERMAIIKEFVSVDEVVLSHHLKNTKDMSICKDLEKVSPDIFANGGDRTKKNIPEVATCRRLGCKMVFNVGGEKVQSSSWLIADFKKKVLQGRV